jgi:hypothetical protein
MSADETVTCYYYEKSDLPRDEFEIKVKCWIDPGQDGATGAYGEPLEPSYGPCVDDYEPVEIRFFPDGNWHNYGYFTNRWGLEGVIDFDKEFLMELCNEKSQKHHF